MNWKAALRQAGVPAALGAALLFDAETPLAKLLLHSVSPWSPTRSIGKYCHAPWPAGRRILCRSLL